SRGFPSAPTIMPRTQVPSYLAWRASSVYSGSGVEIGRGARTPPPTRNTPPPIPPPRPSPMPGPVPLPTPPPDPHPIPPPEPVPFEAGARGIAGTAGSPRLGSLEDAISTFGGATTVG